MDNTRYDVFISYRRETGSQMAMLLKKTFDDMGISAFMDIEELASGRFDVQLYERIKDSKSFLLICSYKSLDRCISNDQDWVRNEIRCALESKKNIVPVILNGFEFPDNLPDDIKGISQYQGARIHEDTFQYSIENKLLPLLFENYKPRSDKSLYEQKKNTAIHISIWKILR